MSDHDSPTRPDSACVTCSPPREDKPWRLADDGYRTCSGCYDRIREALKDIADRYARLDPTPGASGESGSRGAPGFGSRAPASEHVIAMTDRRSSSVARVWVGADGRVHRESERPPLSVWAVLDTAAWTVAEEKGVDGPAPDVSVYQLTRFLDVQLDWITRRELVVEVWSTLRALLSQLRPVTGDQRFRIGTCPNTIDEGEHTAECGAPLFAPASGETIFCPNPACDRSWDRDEWVELGRLLQSEHAA